MSKRIITRFISLFLCTIMLFEFSVQPISAASSNPSSESQVEVESTLDSDAGGVDLTPSESELEAEAENEVSFATLTDVDPVPTDEIISLREENIKHFRMSDNSIVMAVYTEPVHFEKNGQMLEIDTELVPVKAQKAGEFSGYATKANRFEVRFASTANQNQMVTLEEDDYQVSWSALRDAPRYMAALAGVEKQDARATVARVTQERVEPDEASDTFALAAVESEVLYKNVLPNVDFQYIPTNEGVKENIIVNRPQTSYAYSFALSLVGLEARLNDTLP
ncbi:hypothetical protein LJC64_03040 [Ruminococcaceae bacterium OttesenSCG-928-A11]|nr:hypothetical protein [Ruminococcaceae bacterium OttesenSCG-928-A11]